MDEQINKPSALTLSFPEDEEDSTRASLPTTGKIQGSCKYPMWQQLGDSEDAIRSIVNCPTLPIDTAGYKNYKTLGY